MITEARRCGERGWLLYDATFRQQAASRDNADFSRLNQALYATTFLAYGNRRQSCPNCILPDHTGQECALHNPRPAPAIGGSTGTHTTYHEKHSRYFEERPTRGDFRKKRVKRGPALHGMMGCAQRSSVSGSMCALNVQEITGGPCVIWALALWK